MDDGEVELSDHVVLLQQLDSSTNSPNSASVDLSLDDLLKNTTACTHTHTCDLPGPDASGHTHTCYHTHARVLASEEDDSQQKPSSKEPRRPSGNREAVRKYREKKKARAAYLEEEVKKLSLMNQQLVRKLQGQAILEAEILRLRGFLSDLRGKIDDELRVLPFRKQCNSSSVLKDGDCGLRCEADLPCFNPRVGPTPRGALGGTGVVSVSWGENCHPASAADCSVKMGDDIVSPNGHSMDRVETLVPSSSQAD